jgi:hypothetical protein
MGAPRIQLVLRNVAFRLNVVMLTLSAIFRNAFTLLQRLAHIYMYIYMYLGERTHTYLTNLTQICSELTLGWVRRLMESR